ERKRPPTSRTFRPIVERIEARARRTPSATAIWCEGVAASYSDLQRWSAWLASELALTRPAREVLVGLCMKRGAELVGAVLGIWTAGGAVVPLDPEYPPERLRQMARGVSVVVTDAETSSR